MKMKLAVLLSLCVMLAGCSREQQAPQAAASPPASPSAQAVPGPTPSFAPARVLIDTEEGSVIIDAEKAETPEQRSVGLMHRTSLDDDAGMIFLFFEETTGGFYMKNTLIPLSIAFIDGRGSIVKILDMEPCEADPCEIYEPGVPYEAALEVNQGAFDEWGVQEGDRVTVTH